MRGGNKGIPYFGCRYEKHENQMKGCDMEQKVSDWQMNVWSSWACDTVKARYGG